MHAISVKNITKVFPKNAVAVDNLSFDLEQGAILGFLGPNGAGKTTTIQMLLSVLSPTSGTIEYFGKDLRTHRSDVLKDVAFASTYINLPWRLTVWENLDVYGRLYSIPTQERKERIEKFLKFFGVWEMRDKERCLLSAGQSTRLMLAKAFLAHPRVALLDEPTASLDPDIAHEVRTFVKAQRKEYGVSVLFTSHNMDEVTDICDRVIFLRKGKIVANDTPINLAKSIGQTKVELIIEQSDHVKILKTIHAQKYQAVIKENSVTITVDEHGIAKLLTLLAQQHIEYSQISIQKPTLEDYFLQALHLGKDEQEKLL